MVPLEHGGVGVDGGQRGTWPCAKTKALSPSDTVNPRLHPPVKMNDTHSFVVDKSWPEHKAGLLIA